MARRLSDGRKLWGTLDDAPESGRQIDEVGIAARRPPCRGPSWDCCGHRSSCSRTPSYRRHSSQSYSAESRLPPAPSGSSSCSSRRRASCSPPTPCSAFSCVPWRAALEHTRVRSSPPYCAWRSPWPRSSLWRRLPRPPPPRACRSLSRILRRPLSGTGALRGPFPGNRAVRPIGRRSSQSGRLGTTRRRQGSRPPLRTGRRRTGAAGGDSGARRRLAFG